MLTNSIPQALPSQINGVCIPQRRYSKGAGHIPENQNTTLFVRLDGTYTPVDATLREDYTGLIGHDHPALVDAGYTIIIQLEVG